MLLLDLGVPVSELKIAILPSTLCATYTLLEAIGPRNEYGVCPYPQQYLGSLARAVFDTGCSAAGVGVLWIDLAEASVVLNI